ncbi:hypothetical protein M0R72_09375 [Candidatus Pacearchaeota archaeon]|jgi:hypothetical protein|nr:hypothetical protein [Candidatus Pacearchaeota archaeon]
MKLITIRSQIRDVADRFAAQYRGKSGNPAWRETIARLECLDKETATPEDVAAIIGNRSWVCPTVCSECRVESEVVVRLGDEPDYDSNTTWICPSCLQKALTLATQHIEG